MHSRRHDTHFRAPRETFRKGTKRSLTDFISNRTGDRIHRPDLHPRGGVERRERSPARVCQGQHALPPIVLRHRAVNQGLPFEVLQDPAEIAGIDARVASDAGSA
jgi:hypothetical protein